MRSSFVLAALVGLAATSPAPAPHCLVTGDCGNELESRQISVVITNIIDTVNCKIFKICKPTTTTTTSRPAAATTTSTRPVVPAVTTTTSPIGVRTTTSTSVPATVVTTTAAATATSTGTGTTTSSGTAGTALPSASSCDSTVLILARDDTGIAAGSAGLKGYGIPFQGLAIPQAGAPLPELFSGSKGNFGAIIIVDAIAYEYTDGWRSAVTTEQWDAIHKYQLAFGVRMVRINEYPGPLFGAAAGEGCCGVGVEQLISFTDVSDFPTANLKVNAGVSSQGLYHYPATITDTKTTKQVAKFAGGPGVVEGAAAVINNFDGREQFVWFTSWAPEWSATSNYLQHSHIHWMTRGLFLGKRKVHLSAQVDDLQLETDLYYPAGTVFKIRTGDLDAHIAWQRDINSRLAAGSEFWLELAHNGNGDIISATADNRPQDGVCNPNYAVDYPEQIDTPLEFQKPLGTGQDIWGTEFTEYGWSKTCAQRDEFASWFLDSSNLNAFAHLSHTFTHMGLNNATYKDTEREIQFNQAWMTQMGIDKATKFSPKGLVPPAITGMHNGDAIRAWMTNGITNVVGDNTRPPLRAKNEYWPLISNVADNGYDGLLIIPRYATTIYFNCDTAECTTREWIETSAGKGDFNSLLDNARAENTRHLLGLHADPYMFHQANMRQIDMPSITVGSQTGKMSLIMSWVETITQEMGRLTNWPITSLKHDDIGKSFSDRMALDQCEPKLSYSYSNGTTISSVTVSAKGNSCRVPVPVTIPAGTVTSSGAVKADQVGSEPPIQWVTLNGSPVTLNLGQTVGGA
ncbi:hypothetical protein VD0002_g5441 [Verticillium dahliae]|uniref:Extracellular serine-rich protein n=3 Tax=Verticillium dahliae TaxID=27337 RepID=G2XAG2_VERDV|nr:uncharacterized protein VDAG_07065 [Verticillium dahliae VdLs.17]KAH6677985.1 hypothetical protein EV126DRAFT_513345 [Verticillium dahliae]EGY15901.1 hypothetical protein VDAG_07065 [Verticillium dahliae VdLs.17]KAH6702206.1 hypothetical protein EV126DRAFT_507330 [Verticillium dahliae]PNH36180.1 hypothetical protein BJF96_g456 [Verticillium dahliae]PNH52064.1 hypothetical protein VD0003_g5236 [Verticillium dahliae]